MFINLTAEQLETIKDVLRNENRTFDGIQCQDEGLPIRLHTVAYEMAKKNNQIIVAIHESIEMNKSPKPRIKTPRPKLSQSENGMKTKDVNPGTCPACDSINLLWGKNDATTDNDGMNYPFTCNDCGITGTEHYTIRYYITTYDEQSAKAKK